MTTWMIEYVYDDNAAGRDAHRPEHRAYLASLAADNKMPAYGRFTDDGPAGALLIAQAETQAEVESMIASDPFSLHGLIDSYRIREWPAVWAAPQVTQ